MHDVVHTTVQTQNQTTHTQRVRATAQQLKAIAAPVSAGGGVSL